MDRRDFLTGAAVLAGAGLGRPAAADDLTARSEQGVLWVRHGSRPVLAYRLGPVEGPAGIDPLFTRNAYVHPIHAPNGVQVTDDFPPDHRHQRGLFFAWTKTLVRLGSEELHPDFWNLGSGLGRIRGLRGSGRAATGEPARLSTEHVWEARRGDRWEPVLDESWELVVHPPRFTDPLAPSAAYLFDLTSRQKPIVDIDLPLYRYGGISVRGSRAWEGRRSPGRILSSEGKVGTEIEETTARWTDMSGPVDGKEAGIALLEHPSNPRYPNRVRVPPDHPYYIYSLPKGGDFRLEKGREYTFRYRFVVHNGAADPKALNALWEDFAKSGPPG